MIETLLLLRISLLHMSNYFLRVYIYTLRS